MESSQIDSFRFKFLCIALPLTVRAPAAVEKVFSAAIGSRPARQKDMEASFSFSFLLHSNAATHRNSNGKPRNDRELRKGSEVPSEGNVRSTHRHDAIRCDTRPGILFADHTIAVMQSSGFSGTNAFRISPSETKALCSANVIRRGRVFLHEGSKGLRARRLRLFQGTSSKKNFFYLYNAPSVPCFGSGESLPGFWPRKVRAAGSKKTKKK